VTNQGTDVNITIASEAQAEALLRGGHSVVVQQLHNAHGPSEALDDLMGGLVQFGLPGINVNAYLAVGGFSALKPHSDTTDALILHVSGSKSWRLCVPVANHDETKS
jgi:ribosomal protein L16 Arg81 hydroxylase